MSHLKTMNRQERRAAAKYLRVENAKLSDAFQMVPRDQWPADPNPRLWKVWRNNRFCVQAFREAGDVIRLSINRTTISMSGDWVASISWDELQAIKNGVGFSAEMAVEIFPASTNVVNVANMRHLWVLPEPLPFGWKGNR